MRFDEPGVNLNLSFNQLGYITKLSLGTPPQEFTFDIASRTQEFWVRSANCTEYCDINPKYNSSLSKTYQPDGRRVAATFGNVVGTMDGYLSTDTVTIGLGKVEDVLFGEITNVFGSFYEGTNISGILGLGFKPNPPFDFFVDDLLRFTCIHKVAGFTRIDYTPAAGFIGMDAFTVKLLPGYLPVKVTVTVKGLIAAPAASPKA